jgi:hypothetical protein
MGSLPVWLLAASAGAAPAMPPGAFLRSPVPDVNALNHQLRMDPLVVARYRSLLRLSPEMVRATFSQLHLTHLTRDMTLEVHYVHAKETIGAKVRRVRKGTAVFALPNGTPVLAQVCGNPLRSIKAVKKLMNMLPVAVQSIHSVARMSMVDDAPDFDSTEPLTFPMPTRMKARTMITLHDAAPVEVLPEVTDALAPDEMPADQMKPGEIVAPHTITQANNTLANWLSGSTLLGVARILKSHNTIETQTLPAPGAPPVQRILPQKPVTKPITIPITPEANGITLVMALTTMLAVVGLRRRRAR